MISLLYTQISWCQNDKQNLDFEEKSTNSAIANWRIKNVNDVVKLDSVTKLQGKYALKISANNQFVGMHRVDNIITKTF